MLQSNFKCKDVYWISIAIKACPKFSSIRLILITPDLGVEDTQDHLTNKKNVKNVTFYGFI